MARTFTSAGASYLYRTSVPVSGTPLTLSLWFRVTNATAHHTLCFLSRSTAGIGYLGISARGDVSGDPVQAYKDNGTAPASVATSSSGFSANTWHHVAQVVSGDAGNTVYLDGGNSGSDSTSRSFASMSLDRFSLAAFWYSAAKSGTVDGSVADVAIWSAALDVSEIQAMASGLRTSDQVRPESLVAQWPLGGLRPDNDRDQWSKAYDLTAVNSPTSADHPRLWYPSEPQIMQASAAATTKYSWWAWGSYGHV